VAQRPFEVLVVEALGQRPQYRRGNLVVPSFFGQSSGEQVASVADVPAAPGQQWPCAVGDAEAASRSQYRCGEADGGQVSLADLAQADRHPELAVGQVALVGVRHHRRVAQRGCLDRVLVAEVGADQ
jgi:hypothetical protein